MPTPGSAPQRTIRLSTVEHHLDRPIRTGIGDLVVTHDRVSGMTFHLDHSVFTESAPTDLDPSRSWTLDASQPTSLLTWVVPKPDPIKVKERLINNYFYKVTVDIERLMTLLYEVLRDRGELEVAQTLPWLGAVLDQDAPVIDVTTWTKKHIGARSIAFELLNMTEENAAMKYRRDTLENPHARPVSGLWDERLQALQEKGLDPMTIVRHLANVSIEPVTTAHPTESRQDDDVRILRKIYLKKIEIENSRWSSRELETKWGEMRTLLEDLCDAELSFSPSQNGESQARSLQNERDNARHYPKNVFPNVIRKHDEQMLNAMKAAGFPDEAIAYAMKPENRPKINFGNWVGTDRDGHPGVTPEFTAETLQLQRNDAIQIIRCELTTMAQQLSLSSSNLGFPSELKTAIRSKQKALGEKADSIIKAHSNQPWRQFALLMEASLPAETESFQKPDEYQYQTLEELLEDFAILRRTLAEVDRQNKVEAYVYPAERTVRVFGFHLQRSDIRQNSDYHDAAIVELARKAGVLSPSEFESWSAEQRLSWLQTELQSKPRFLDKDSSKGEIKGIGKHADNVLNYLKVIKDYRNTYSTAGLGPYIVSTTRSAADLVTVYALAREVGLIEETRDYGKVSQISVVPLFETIEDLKNSPHILRAFLEDPITSNTLNYQESQGKPRRMQVMLGYSDSNKDGGIWASAYHLYMAQRELVAVAAEFGVEIEFFHGSGGTPSRGAGPMHHFFQQLPHGSLASGVFRQTIQGQTLHQKFSNEGTAAYNLELMIAGAVATSLSHKAGLDTDDDLDPYWEIIVEQSMAAYRGFRGVNGGDPVNGIKVQDQTTFIEFYNGATPIDILRNLKIGSRQASRKSSEEHGIKSLGELRAIPWVMSWYQNGSYIPGWYGSGRALSHLRDEHPEAYARFKQNANSKPLERYHLIRAHESFASAKLEVTRLHATNVIDEFTRDTFMTLIEEDYRLFDEIIDDVYADSIRIRPRLARTLDLRDEPLSDLHDLQVYLIAQRRQALEEDRDDDAQNYFALLTETVNAIAMAERATG